MMRDNTVDIFVEWFQMQGWKIESETVLVNPNGQMVDLISLANFLEIKEKQGQRYTTQ